MRVCVFQDGCYPEGADEPSEGSISRGQKKGNSLQLCHRLSRPQRENVQVGVKLQRSWLGTQGRSLWSGLY